MVDSGVSMLIVAALSSWDEAGFCNYRLGPHMQSVRFMLVTLMAVLLLLGFSLVVGSSDLLLIRRRAL